MNNFIPNHTPTSRRVFFDESNNVYIIQAAVRKAPQTTTLQRIEHQTAYELFTYFNDLDGNQIGLAAVREVVQRYGTAYLDKAEISNDFNRVTYKLPDFTISIAGTDHQKSKDLSGEEILDRLNSIATEVRNYLFGFNPPNASYNLVPAGFGWDGKHTNFELNRANRIKQLLIGDKDWKIDRALIEEICELSYYSPNGGIVTHWDRAEPIPEIFNLVKPINDSKFIVIGQNKDVSEIVLNSDADVNLIPPNGYDRFIVVTLRYLKNRNGPYGLKIEIFKGT